MAIFTGSEMTSFPCNKKTMYDYSAQICQAARQPSMPLCRQEPVQCCWGTKRPSMSLNATGSLCHASGDARQPYVFSKTVGILSNIILQMALRASAMPAGMLGATCALISSP